VTFGSRVREDLIVVATGERLVTEKVDSLVFNAGDGLLSLDVLQAVRLVPTGGEDIEGNLTANGVAVHNTCVSLFLICWENTARTMTASNTYVNPNSGNSFFNVSTRAFRMLWILSYLTTCQLSQPADNHSLVRKTRCRRDETYASNSFRSSTLALRPIGLTLIIPLRNSIKVPRFLGNVISDIYRRMKLTNF
jgi:hypothetical protein